MACGGCARRKAKLVAAVRAVRSSVAAATVRLRPPRRPPAAIAYPRKPPPD